MRVCPDCRAEPNVLALESFNQILVNVSLRDSLLESIVCFEMNQKTRVAGPGRHAAISQLVTLGCYASYRNGPVPVRTMIDRWAAQATACCAI